jgi:hypothetical protein
MEEEEEEEEEECRLPTGTPVLLILARTARTAADSSNSGGTRDSVFAMETDLWLLRAVADAVATAAAAAAAAADDADAGGRLAPGGPPRTTASAAVASGNWCEVGCEGVLGTTGTQAILESSIRRAASASSFDFVGQRDLFIGLLSGRGGGGIGNPLPRV